MNFSQRGPCHCSSDLNFFDMMFFKALKCFSHFTKAQPHMGEIFNKLFVCLAFKGEHNIGSFLTFENFNKDMGKLPPSHKKRNWKLASRLLHAQAPWPHLLQIPI